MRMVQRLGRPMALSTPISLDCSQMLVIMEEVSEKQEMSMAMMMAVPKNSDTTVLTVWMVSRPLRASHEEMLGEIAAICSMYASSTASGTASWVNLMSMVSNMTWSTELRPASLAKVGMETIVSWREAMMAYCEKEKKGAESSIEETSDTKRDLLALVSTWSSSCEPMSSERDSWKAAPIITSTF